MSEVLIMQLLQDAIKITLMLAAPTLATSLIIGLVVSIFQATTQIQEQTLTFVPKLIGIAVILMLCGSWMLNTLVSYTEELLYLISTITK